MRKKGPIVLEIAVSLGFEKIFCAQSGGAPDFRI
jgi:hypothetical protein